MKSVNAMIFSNLMMVENIIVVFWLFVEKGNAYFTFSC